MATINDQTLGTSMAVEIDKQASRTFVVARGDGYAMSNITGTIAAALAANAAVFAMRLDPSSGKRAFIDRLRLQFTTLVAYTVPITAGRRLALYRGSGAAASGGTAIATAVKKHTASASLSEFDIAQGGDIRIATTGALTVTGITFEAEPIATMMLVHAGNAGAYVESIFEFSATESAELVLEPGQVFAIRAPQLMDAAGTWQLGVNAQWREANAF